MRETLCCCEYIAEDGEVNHILGCCCNCVELDSCFDRLVSCRRIPRRSLIRIMATISDRLRLPWKHGAIKVTFDTVAPLFIVPLVLWSATLGVWLSVIIFTFLPIFLMYSHFFYVKCHSQSNFFLVWAITSVLLIFLQFEFLCGDLKIRADENVTLILLFLTMALSFYQVKTRAKQSLVSNEREEVGMALCTVCYIKVPERAYHCFMCQSCILMRDQHCAWLNCCVGKWNHRWYMALMLLSIAFFLLSSNLVLTTLCHPFTIWSRGIEIMLPDDCTDVYAFEPWFTMILVTAIYELEALVLLLSLFFHEIWLISVGMTGHEWRNGISHRRCCFGCISVGQYSKGFCSNWFLYLRGIDLPISTQTI